MKAETHFCSAIPALLMREWLFLPGALIPDTAHAIMWALQGFKLPYDPASVEKCMWLYRIGHSLLFWIPLAVLGWQFPWARPFFMGVLMHLVLDYPTHSQNHPFYPFKWLVFDGKGA